MHQLSLDAARRVGRVARRAGAGGLDVRLLRRTSRATPRKARTRGLDAPRRQASALLDGGISTIGTQTTLGWANRGMAEATVGCTILPRAIKMTISLKSCTVICNRLIGRPAGVLSGTKAAPISLGPRSATPRTWW